MGKGGPTEEGVYIIYAPSADPGCPLMVSAFWFKEECCWSLVPVWNAAVTHWMPLPAAPIGEGVKVAK